MRSNLQSYIQTLLVQLKQRTDANHSNVEGNILSFATALTQESQSMCARITARFHRIRRDVLDLGEGLS